MPPTPRAEDLFDALADALTARFGEHVARVAEAAGQRVEVPAHRVRFSKRITTSWALIYYRRHEIRLSPYLFLLEPSELKHGGYFEELDATMAHEAVHAYLWAREKDGGHSPAFHDLYAALGWRANGSLDLGPPNVAFRFVYRCPSCARTWQRRARLTGNWSCGSCSAGRYEPAFRMALAETLDAPWTRVAARAERVAEALARARAGPARVEGFPVRSPAR